MNLQPDTVLLSFPLFCACLMTSSTMAQHVFPGRHFDESIRNNCTSCMEKLHMNVAEVLPRLTLIKQRILNALGRSGENEEMRNDSPFGQGVAPEMYKLAGTSTTQKPTQQTVPMRNHDTNEIISFSEPIGTIHGDPVMTFRVQHPQTSERIEAIGASLLLFVERRRKMKTGGRGKKISIQISKIHTDKNNSAEILTYLRTRVKRRRWKTLSLPVTLAQSLLDNERGSIDLSVRCIGCGRLVNVVIYASKGTQSKRHSRQERRVKHKHRKLRRNRTRHRPRHRSRHRHRTGSNPILVIRTRYRV